MIGALAELKQVPPPSGFALRLERALSAEVATLADARAARASQLEVAETQGAALKDVQLLGALTALKQKPPISGFEKRLGVALAQASASAAVSEDETHSANVGMIAALAKLKQPPPRPGFDSSLQAALFEAAGDVRPGVVVTMPLQQTVAAQVAVVPSVWGNWQRAAGFAAAAAVLLVMVGGVVALLQSSSGAPVPTAENVAAMASADREESPALKNQEPEEKVRPKERPVIPVEPLPRVAPRTRSSRADGEARSRKLQPLRLRTHKNDVARRPRRSVGPNSNKLSSPVVSSAVDSKNSLAREIPRLRLQTQQLVTAEKSAVERVPTEAAKGARPGRRERFQQRMRLSRQQLSESRTRGRPRRPRVRTDRARAGTAGSETTGRVQRNRERRERRPRQRRPRN